MTQLTKHQLQQDPKPQNTHILNPRIKIQSFDIP